MRFSELFSRRGRNINLNVFFSFGMPGWGQIDSGVEILEFSVFLPNDLADIFNGESVWE